MQNKQKKIITLIAILLLIIILVLLYYINAKTYYSEPNTIGNTAGNLYNGGLFCEYDGRIYFSNKEDDGALYSMDLDCNYVKKISDDKCGYLNMDEYYIYYARMNYAKENGQQSIFCFYNSGVYRIDHNGKNIKMLYNSPSGLLSLFDNKINYQHYNTKTGITLYQIGINGKKETKITEDPILPASYYNGMLYYASAASTHSIYTMDMDSHLISPAYDGNCYMPIATKDGIYFLDLSNNYALCRVNFDGTNKTTLVDRFVSSYNISSDGKYLIFQIDGGEHNRIAVLDLTTMEMETITDGNYKQIHVTTNYVFFNDFNDTNTYAYDLNTGILTKFIPPVID